MTWCLYEAVLYLLPLILHLLVCPLPTLNLKPTAAWKQSYDQRRRSHSRSIPISNSINFFLTPSALHYPNEGASPLFAQSPPSPFLPNWSDGWRSSLPVILSLIVYWFALLLLLLPSPSFPFFLSYFPLLIVSLLWSGQFYRQTLFCGRRFWNGGIGLVNISKARVSIYKQFSNTAWFACFIGTKH